MPGMGVERMRAYLEYVAEQRLTRLGMPIRYGTANPFAFMSSRTCRNWPAFFERRVSAYQVAVEGNVSLTRSSRDLGA